MSPDKTAPTAPSESPQAAAGIGASPRASPLLVGLFIIHTVLLGFSAWWHSPTQDECAHLTSGLAIWRFGRFDLYRVNPPLVRAWATWPLLFLDHKEDWIHYVPESHRRSEWDIGADFVTANGLRSLWLCTVARWMCLPFSWLGMFVCWRWGRSLAGDRGGLVAAWLWCFSPNVIGHGSLITPDIPAVAFGLWSAWRFRHWLERHTWRNAFGAGICLGLALLVKSSWVVLLVLWPLIGLINLWAHESGRSDRWRTIGQLALILILGITVLNLGYGYYGTGRRLGEFPFFSRALAGELKDPEYDPPGNRFSSSWIGRLPMPLPAEFVSGIDLQKRDFEVERWNYLFGKHRRTGWWYYYLVGLGVKVPLGTWLLAILGGATLLQRLPRGRIWYDLVPLSAPALAVFVLASSQTGMNHHVRYVFSMLPVLFILAGGCALRRRVWLTALGLYLTAAASLSVFPHSLSFFNALAGGPRYGHNVLISSNVEWGQDLILVRRWLDRHPEARPATLASVIGYPAAVIGLQLPPPPREQLTPGWHILSVHLLHDPYGAYDEYLKLDPVDRVGFSFNVYHIPAQEGAGESGSSGGPGTAP